MTPNSYGSAAPGQLRRIRRSLDDNAVATLVHAFVASRVDYCGSIRRHTEENDGQVTAMLQCVWCRTLASMTEVRRTFGVTFCTGWMSLIASGSESASRCSSVSMGWHRTTCLLCATLYPDSLDARAFALRIADSSTFHALHWHRAVSEPSRMLVHLCGTLCPFISRTAI